MWQECDEKVIKAFVNGDNQAFEDIMEFYETNIKTYVTPYFQGGSIIDAEDVIQDIWLKVWNSRTQFNKTFAGWLFSIVKNTCTEAKKSQQKETNAINTYAESKELNGIDPVEEIISEENKIKLRNIIQKLSPLLAECLRLKYYGHKSYEEIAKILSVSTGTVKSRLNEAHKKLKELW